MRKHNQIQKTITDLINEGVLWGASYGFVGQTKEVFYEGVQGGEKPWSERRIEAGMLYDLASVSKVVGTTTRILQLIDQNEIGFDTPVKKLLPAFVHPQVTVSHLLLHNSGLSGDLSGKYQMSRERLLKELYALPLQTEPGSQICYSDAGYILLGLIIQAVEQYSLEESMQKNIFKPLGMKNTSYHPQVSIERFLPEERRKDRGMVCGKVHDSKAYLLGESGSAGLFSTLDDLLIFAEHYLAQDSILFSRRIFQKILETEVGGRGYGWNLEYGKGILYHTGFTGTSMLLDMKNGEGFVLLTNRIHPSRQNTVFLEKRRELNRMWLTAADGL